MFQISAFAFFLLPMTIILIMYALIGVTLYRSEMIGDNKSFSNSSAASSSIGQRNNNHVYDPTKARKSVLKMLGKYRITSFKLKIISNVLRSYISKFCVTEVRIIGTVLLLFSM